MSPAIGEPAAARGASAGRFRSRRRVRRLRAWLVTGGAARGGAFLTDFTVVLYRLATGRRSPDEVR